MMMSSVARVKFNTTKITFRFHTKGISNQVSSYSNHEIKSYSYLNSSTKIVKNGFSELQNGAIKRLQIGARGITNRGNFRDFKSG